MPKIVTYSKGLTDISWREADNRNRQTTTMAKLTSSPAFKAPEPKRDLLQELKKLVVGQDHVLEEIVPLIYRFEVGLAPSPQPLGVVLLLGPTGVGKTHLCESLAEILTGSVKNLIKVDCAEFAHGHEIAKLVGAPSGYLGHRETPAYFTQRKMTERQGENFKANFILFDEIEKAHETLYNLLLGILDKSILTLGDNSVVEFNKSFIFMTSNLGARDMEAARKPGYGLSSEDIKDSSFSKVAALATAAAKKHFLPEFMNRIDVTAVYKPLSEESLSQILGQVLWSLQERISGVGRPFVLRVGSASRTHLLKEGFSRDYGARELKRTVERLITRPLTLKMREEPRFFERAANVEVLVDGSGTVFRAS